MKNLLKILIGLVLIVVPLYLIFPGSCLNSWGIATIDLIKGGITIFVFLTGFVLIFIGINNLKK